MSLLADLNVFTSGQRPRGYYSRYLGRLTSQGFSSLVLNTQVTSKANSIISHSLACNFTLRHGKTVSRVTCSLMAWCYVGPALEFTFVFCWLTVCRKGGGGRGCRWEEDPAQLPFS